MYLSKERREIFGLGALGVFATHCAFVFPSLSFVQKAMSYGGAMVYVFALLCGGGVYYSLSKDKEKNGVVSLKNFYKRRFLRVIVPYLLIAGIWYFIEHIVLSGDFLYFLYDLSTLSFWIADRGIWYVAMLIPVYLVFPFYFKWIERGHRGVKTACVAVGLLAVFAALYPINAEVWNRLSLVLLSFVFVVIGAYVGALMYHGIFHFWYFTLGFALVVLLKLLPVSHPVLDLVTYAAVAVVATCLFAWVMDKLTWRPLHICFTFLGDQSLEFYVVHVFVLKAFRIFGFSTWMCEQSRNVQRVPEVLLIFLISLLISTGVMHFTRLLFKKRQVQT